MQAMIPRQSSIVEKLTPLSLEGESVSPRDYLGTVLQINEKAMDTQRVLIQPLPNCPSEPAMILSRIVVGCVMPNN